MEVLLSTYWPYTRFGPRPTCIEKLKYSDKSNLSTITIEGIF